MATFRTTFFVTGVVPSTPAVAGSRWRGHGAPVFQAVGRFLPALAILAALFPAALASLGPAPWAAAYVGFVVALTGVMTAVAVARARMPRAWLGESIDRGAPPGLDRASDRETGTTAGLGEGGLARDRRS